MTYRSTDYTLEFVADLLYREGVLPDDARRTAFAREGVQRARLLRDGASRSGARSLNLAEVSPVAVLASFGFSDARRDAEVVDEDKATQAVARAVGIPYRKIDPLKLDAQLITRTLSRPFARKHAVLPLERRNGARVLSSATDIHRAIAEVYGFRQQISQARVELEGGAGAPDVTNLEQFVNLSG